MPTVSVQGKRLAKSKASLFQGHRQVPTESMLMTGKAAHITGRGDKARAGSLMSVRFKH